MSWLASPTPMLSVIFSIRGTSSAVLVTELLGHRLDDARRHTAACRRGVYLSAIDGLPGLHGDADLLAVLASRSGRGSACRPWVGDARPCKCASALACGRCRPAGLPGSACGGGVATLTPSTTTLPSLGMTLATVPVRPLSLPDRTTTLVALLDLRGSHHSTSGARQMIFMKPFAAQLAHHRAEDTGADRLLVLVDQHRGVAVEADDAAVGAADVLARCARSPRGERRPS